MLTSSVAVHPSNKGQLTHVPENFHRLFSNSGKEVLYPELDCVVVISLRTNIPPTVTLRYLLQLEDSVPVHFP